MDLNLKFEKAGAYGLLLHILDDYSRKNCGFITQGWAPASGIEFFWIWFPTEF